MIKDLTGIKNALTDLDKDAFLYLLTCFQKEAVTTSSLNSNSLSDFRGWLTYNADLILEPNGTNTN